MTLYDDASAAFHRGDNEKTRALAEELRRSGQEVEGLCWLARVELREGDFSSARELATQARQTARDEEEGRAPLHVQAAAARMAGDVEGARSLYLESIELNRRLDKPFVAAELYNLGFLELNAGDLARAKRLFDEALEEARSREDDAVSRYIVLARGALAVEEGDARKGVRLLAAGEDEFARGGEVLDPDDRAEVDRALEKARTVLSPEEFAQAEAAGRGLSVDEALS